MENKFSPRKVNLYSLDELFEFCETGLITLEELENAGLNERTLFDLKFRIQRFREVKENDDWNSVKDSHIEEIVKYYHKYKDEANYVSNAFYRLKFIEEQHHVESEISFTKEMCLDKLNESKKALEQIADKLKNQFSHYSLVERKISEIERIIYALDDVMHDLTRLNEYGSPSLYSLNMMRERPNRYTPNTPKESYTPKRILDSFNWNIFKKKTLCNSAVFAPAEIAEGDDLFVQVYIYKDEDTDEVIIDSRMSDKDTTQRSYTPLNFPIKKGDKISIRLDMHGLSIEGDNTKSVIWQNKYTKCSFFVYVPINYYKSKVKGDVYLSVNGLELGQMSFFSTIGNRGSACSAQVETKVYKKVFISYSHKDDATVKSIAEAYKALGTVDYFYDRHTLSPGDFFEKEIYEYIDQCDLFVLCWSKNAEDSEWVKKERVRAFNRAIDSPPRLKLYPINIRPYAAPPSDMAGKIHFEDYDKIIDLPENQEELKE